MTDNEIIKALERCGNGEECGECQYYCADEKRICFEVLEFDALDLINRQKAEIERLQHKNSELQHEISSCKTEAIKEFAERLKEKVDGTETIITAWLEGYIDYLVREMTGV